MGIGSTIAAVHNIPGTIAKSAASAVKSAGTALQTLSAFAQNMGGEKTQKLESARRFVQVGCYETIQTLRPYPKIDSLLLSQNRSKTLDALLKTLNVKPIALEMETSRRVEVGCYMTVHTAPDFSARRVVDSLIESQARRMANPSLMAMILREADTIAQGRHVEVGCYEFRQQSIPRHPTFNTLRKIEYAFSPIAGALSYVGKSIVDFWKAL